MTQTELLKAALKERGVTQRAVAEQLHTTEQALSKTLSRPTLTTTKLAAIIDAVNALYRASINPVALRDPSAQKHLLPPLTTADLQPLPDTLVINGVTYIKKEEK